MWSRRLGQQSVSRVEKSFLRHIPGKHPTQAMAISHQEEEWQDYRRNKGRVEGARNKAERYRVRKKIETELRARSDRHFAESQMFGALLVAAVDIVEPLLFHGLGQLWNRGTRSACPWCGKPLPRIGDAICERSKCRKAAERATRVDQLPLPQRQRGRPSKARFVAEVPPEAGWSEVNLRMGTSRFRGRDPLAGRTEECHAHNGHDQCPGGYDGRIGETPDEQGRAVPLVGWIRCPCKCHTRPIRPWQSAGTKGAEVVPA